MAVLPPTGLLAVVGNEQVLLTWNAVTNAVSYDVYRDTAKIATVGASPVLNVGQQKEEYLDTGLVNDTSYDYQVDVTTDAGTSAQSAIVAATPKTILVLEDGTGIEGANTYISLDDTLQKLANFGYQQFSSINVFQEPVLVRATSSVDASMSYSHMGSPTNTDQGLYHPRIEFPICDGNIHGSVNRRSDLLTLSSIMEVPENALLVSALKAEFIALDEFDSSNLFSDIPGNIKRVELAKGVQVEKFQGRLQNGRLESLRRQITGLLQRLSNETPIFLGGP